MLRAIAGVGGLAAVAALITPASAWAQPAGPLIETTCSYPQIEAALQVEAPEASARLAEHPDARARVQKLLALPVEERKQRVQSFRDRNPDVAARIDEKRATPQGQEKLQKMQRVADTCHNY